MFFEDNVHSYSYKDIMVSTNVLFVIYVISLHVFLQISVEYAKCVKYKYNKIQKKIYVISE